MTEPEPQLQDPDPHRTLQPLRATSTRTERATAASDVPLVVLDGETPGEDAGRTLPELLGEVKSLRTRNQILRTERTSIAGRKYALEVALESLRERLGVLVDACARLDVPPELAAAVQSIRDLLGDAHRIAQQRSAQEGELEAERAAQLEQAARAEARLSELSEEAAGLRVERDALRGELQRLSRAGDQSREALEREVAASRARQDELAAQLGEAQAGLAAARAEQDQRARDAGAAREEAARQADEARGRAAAAEAAVVAVRAELEAARAVQAEATRRMEEARTDLAARDRDLTEHRETLAQVRPLLDDLLKLDLENQRLARLVGEARARGRVDVQELFTRASLLKRLERLTGAPPTGAPPSRPV